MYHKPEDIQRSFETYYKNLYTQPHAAELQNVAVFFNLSGFTINNIQNRIMTQLITEEEINKAISRLKTVKMPGADGYPSIYVLRGGETPLSWRQALISVISKYLGVYIPKDLSTIYDHNYALITGDIKSGLNRWSLLSPNMHNQIDIIRINILPRFLFLFQSLPFAIPPKQFQEWNRMISTFIGAKCKPQIRFQTLQLHNTLFGRFFWRSQLTGL